MRRMKVKELMAILSKLPEDDEVAAYYSLFVGDKKIILKVEE